MTTWKAELENRNIAVSMRKSVENLVISSQDAIGQSISQALSFSGVVTNPPATLQENKNLSRSPSPSLRHAESNLDVTDNDRRSDKSDTSQVPSFVSDVAVGLDAAALVAKDVKAASPSARGDPVRSKKKSWYNSLYPTYKSKCEDFKRLFKELPDDEKLIVDYSCALQRDILVHGRLYASQRHLCFHANIFGWEKVLTIRWKDVTAITKEKTARVIPNAILICTESEKNFLASFTGRDKAYLMLFRIWQNALMDQPMSSNEILQLVHACYGAELGFDSDEDARDATDATDANDGHDGHEHTIDVSEEAVDSSSVEAGETRPDYPPLTNGNSEFREEAGDTLPTDMSDTSESEPEKHNNNGEDEKCTAPHEGKLLLQQEFPFNVDQLFTMIFTNSKFSLELLAARGTKDYVQNPWQPQNGLKCRQVSYTLGLTSGPMGPKEVHVTEVQVMNKCSKPGVLYSICCSNENTGIPYADYFSVEAHYCLRRSGERSALELYGHVNYKKTMWPLIKAFLEKNAMSGLEEYARLLESRLLSAVRPARPARPPPALQARTRRRRRGDGTHTNTHTSFIHFRFTFYHVPALSAVGPRPAVGDAPGRGRRRPGPRGPLAHSRARAAAGAQRAAVLEAVPRAARAGPRAPARQDGLPERGAGGVVGARPGVALGQTARAAAGVARRPRPHRGASGADGAGSEDAAGDDQTGAGEDGRRRGDQGRAVSAARGLREDGPRWNVAFASYLRLSSKNL